MIRFANTRLSYQDCRLSADRAAAVSREALGLIAQRVARFRSGRIARLLVLVRVHRNAADHSLAGRIADAVEARLAAEAKGER